MSDEAAFLSAIREHPDEDTPRLAFADWLDEQGDSAKSERAAFIRAQVELARLPSDDPRCVDLEVIERRLLAKHATEWAAPWPAFSNLEYAGDVPRRAVFRRGFLEAVDGLSALGSTNTNDFAELCAAHPIRDGGVFPTNNLASAANWPEWGRIESLALWSRPTNRDVATEFAHYREQLPQIDFFLRHADLTRLRKLKVTLVGISDRDVLHWFRMPIVQRLVALNVVMDDGMGWDVERNGDSVLELARGDFPNIRELSLVGNARPDYSRAVTQLVDSDIWKQITQFTHFSERHFPWFRALATARLQRLTLHTGFSASARTSAHEFADAMQATSGPATLTELRINGPAVHGETLSRVLAARATSNLRQLHLVRARLTDDSLRRIAASPALGNLNALSLWLHDTAGEGLHALFASPNLGRLTDLRIHGGRVPPDAVRALARNGSCRRLRTLALGSLFVPSALTALTDGDEFPDLHTIAFECSRPSPEPATIETFVNAPKFPRLCVVQLDIDYENVKTLMPVFRNSKRLAWVGGEMGDGWDGTRVALVPENVYLPNHMDGLSE